MAKEEKLTMDGVVEELLPDMSFIVKLENGRQIIAYLCGKMKMRNIRVARLDAVVVEVSPYDLTKGRIVYRKR